LNLQIIKPSMKSLGEMRIADDWWVKPGNGLLELNRFEGLRWSFGLIRLGLIQEPKGRDAKRGRWCIQVVTIFGE
jgi:hypothetical protein